MFLFKHGIFDRNPNEPLGPGPLGSSPMRYFADRLAGLTDDDIAFMIGRMHGHTGTWYDGVDALTQRSIKQTIGDLQPALDQGWELGGVVLAIGPGDADTRREIQTYEARFAAAVHRIRSVFHDDDLPIFNMQTALPLGNDLKPDVEARIKALRHEMADVGHHIHNVDTVLSDPHWKGVPGHSGLSHLAVAGQVLFGHALADAVFDFWS